MTRRVRLVVLGGSALATPLLFGGLANAGAGRAYEAVLYGRDEERLELVRRVSQDMVDRQAAADIRVSYEKDLARAVRGADFVINQMRVGGLKGRLFDETFPRRFNIPGEETVGPGGFNNTRRGIPVILEACRQIEANAPGAILLNLMNPSSLIQYAIRRYSNVQVLGTCDSPVSLMDMIAGLLGARRADLHFDVVGMHHFTWIVGVQQGSLDRMPEVLRRAHELPKLGVDPDLIRLLGAIPSPYFKYYAHPDRLLAMTEGRPTRANELMLLQDEMLDEFRRWTPGEALPSLIRRGAVWYDKIVIPTLLALAEKRTTELIRSLDNNGALPWLPAAAIVELPVPIRGGSPAKPRRSDLPQDIRTLVARNAAYEMMAVESIVEDDRELALRALLSNLLVDSYNQAKGILDVVWPVPQKSPVKVRLASQPVGSLKVPRLHYGDRLLETL
ncbi:MAG: hypothetical protein M1337_04190, partial [Actinobacteria bacterium]|nr:hypothetical protein [Actinomycetota bacterium]